MTDDSDRAIQALGKKISDSLYDVIQSERPTKSVLLGALGLAAAHCIVCNVPTYDQPDAASDLAAHIESAVPMIGGAASPEAEARRGALFQSVI
jgi:hypothetical protein